MRKGRASYSFEIKQNEKEIEKLVKYFIYKYDFKIFKGDEEYYVSKQNIFLFNKYFSYSFKEGKLTIFAWIKGIMSEYSTEQKGVSLYSFLINDYKAILNRLFSLINEFNDGSRNSFVELALEEIENKLINGEVTFEVKEEVTEEKYSDNEIIAFFQKKNMLDLSFVLSVLFMILVFLRYNVFLFFILYNLGIGFLSLNTSRGKEAILVMVMSAVALIMSLIQIAFGVY